MRAVAIDEFVKDLANVKVKDVPKPEINRPNDLLVKITHASITHVDTLYALGHHQNNKRHVQPPFILGNEFAGIVDAAPAHSCFRKGARVFGGKLGSYAEWICVDESAGDVREVPRDMTNAEAVAVGVSGAVSWGGLVKKVGFSVERMGMRAQLKQGEWALILGASGGLGAIAVQIAKAAGAKVIAVVGSKEKAELVQSIGADEVIDYHEPMWEDKVKSLAGGEGVHVVYDAIGAIESGLKCLRYGGRLVIVGFAARGGQIEDIKANRILLKGVSVIGYRFGEEGRRDPRTTKEAWDGFMEMVRAGKIKPVAWREKYGLEDVPRALLDLQAHRVAGRAVVTIDEGAEEGVRARL
ncbi:hypothetical protein K491DRAFT_680075 [Lophiostoma macrostomum CBS 122681]|uniref:Enoyl reductase (ER) domain-containing protein n=1 Tax=Lophiostoma macrostomum CBS 122681 TaxID=1314788 RepID=A0A6A6T5W3_9PLEO|nr:hypothetical protein K491DRAFT_680075 [Lophiostoma macrostomum CBS 122681]